MCFPYHVAENQRGFTARPGSADFEIDPWGYRSPVTYLLG